MSDQRTAPAPAIIMERSGSSDYVLTPKGRSLAVALTEWEDAWAFEIEPPILYRHTECDGAVHAQAACDRCGGIPAEEVAARIGPGMPAEYLASRRGGSRDR